MNSSPQLTDQEKEAELAVAEELKKLGLPVVMLPDGRHEIPYGISTDDRALKIISQL